MRENQHFENLRRRVLEASENNIWEQAVQEWEIVDCELDDNQIQSCICGKDRLKYLFTIRNSKNENELYPIGSTCIKQFEREDLNFEVSAYEDMFKLIHAVENREYIKLTSEYFSRNLLKYLCDKDAFGANQYNAFEPRNDYRFMLAMFNKRNKEEIDESLKKKARAIIKKSIIPFIEKRVKMKKQICPRCGADLIMREAKKGPKVGEKFWGCSKFPACKYTKNME